VKSLIKTLGLTNQEVLMRARADLRLGIPIVLAGKENDVILAPTENLNQTRLEQFKRLDKNAFILITARRAKTLKCPVYEGNFARIKLNKETSSANLQAISDPSLDLKNPFQGPFKIIRETSLKIENEALLLLKSAQLLPAAVVSRVHNGAEFSEKFRLTYLTTKIVSGMSTGSKRIADTITAHLPTERAKTTQFHIFKPLISGEEHYAIEIGKIDRKKPVMVRIHSACFTGDVLGSLKCDCGPQLHTATRLINESGSGILIYLNQEGRGIGLANKIRAYSLQDQGFDTVEANHRLGFEDDERNFELGASILKEMRVGAIQLITNNPTKISTMAKYDIIVTERIPLVVGKNKTNLKYLETKVKKSGHLM